MAAPQLWLRRSSASVPWARLYPAKRCHRGMCRTARAPPSGRDFLTLLILQLAVSEVCTSAAEVSLGGDVLRGLASCGGDPGSGGDDAGRGGNAILENLVALTLAISTSAGVPS